MISGTFEGEDDFAPWSGLDVVECQLEGARDGPTDLQGPGLFVDHGSVVMRDAKEPRVRCQPSVQVFPLLLVLDISGRGVGKRWRLVSPRDDFLAGASRKGPGQR